MINRSIRKFFGTCQPPSQAWHGSFSGLLPKGPAVPNSHLMPLSFFTRIAAPRCRQSINVALQSRPTNPTPRSGPLQLRFSSTALPPALGACAYSPLPSESFTHEAPSSADWLTPQQDATIGGGSSNPSTPRYSFHSRTLPDNLVPLRCGKDEVCVCNELN